MYDHHIVDIKIEFLFCIRPQSLNFYGNALPFGGVFD